MPCLGGRQAEVILRRLALRSRRLSFGIGCQSEGPATSRGYCQPRLALAGVGVSAALGAFDNNPKAVPTPAPPGLETAQASPGQGVGSVDPNGSLFSVRFVVRQSRLMLLRTHASGGAFTTHSSNLLPIPVSRGTCIRAPDGDVYLVPAQGRLCLVTVGVSTGVTVGCNALSDAINNGMSTIFPDGTVTTLVGVYPDGTQDVTITDYTGTKHLVVLGPDNGYWTSVSQPTLVTVTAPDGSVRTSTVPGG
jgi:hypothetical protein